MQNKEECYIFNPSEFVKKPDEGNIYCISDIHGCFEEFMALLKEINFKPKDTLYVLGDVVDRGREPIKCLQYIMDADNIHMLMGNHELLMWQTLVFKDDCKYGETEMLWQECYDGRTTCIQLSLLSKYEQEEIVNYIEKLPYYHIVTVQNKKYLLVHAGIDIGSIAPDVPIEEALEKQSALYMLKGSEAFYRGEGLLGYTVIFGHIPTRQLRSELHNNDIWHDNNKIGIDCGCCDGGCLAALRLNDMKEFYVPKFTHSSEEDYLMEPHGFHDSLSW